MSIGDLEKVALQIRQVNTEVNAPVGAAATGPADGSGIGGADAEQQHIRGSGQYL